MTLEVLVARDDGVDNDPDTPDDDSFSRWAAAALTQAARPTAVNTELSLRITGAAEMRALNNRYRGRDQATNVLAFPADLPADIDPRLLGDVVLCAPVIAAEATAQQKALSAHWAHMTVHGTLHLLGFDHITEAEAREMEALEIAALASLGIDDPYLSAADGAA